MLNVVVTSQQHKNALFQYKSKEHLDEKKQGYE
jgi:hypothetical protein